MRAEGYIKPQIDIHDVMMFRGSVCRTYCPDRIRDLRSKTCSGCWVSQLTVENAGDKKIRELFRLPETMRR